MNLRSASEAAFTFDSLYEEIGTVPFFSTLPLDRNSFVMYILYIKERHEGKRSDCK